jgi:hypothetical protein
VPKATALRPRAAETALRRVERQKKRLRQRYSSATTSRDRLTVLIRELYAASAPGSHQPNPALVDAILRQLCGHLRQAVERLHEEQEAAARGVVEAAAKRRERRTRARAQRAARTGTTRAKEVRS